MLRCSLKSFFPTADDVLAADEHALGMAVLDFLKGNQGDGQMWQLGYLTKRDLRAVLDDNKNEMLGPMRQREYGHDQPKVTEAVMEAVDWLQRNGYLIEANNPGQLSFTRKGRDGFEKPKAPVKHALSLINEERLAELRAIKSAQFDFKKVIRICEELNIAARENCYLAVGMLTRALLDHVPPIFGVKSFSELANNYTGGSKSFKETMLHLDTAAKKIADGLLHTQIRKSETLPAPQQVSFGPALDLLLGEIVRITQ